MKSIATAIIVVCVLTLAAWYLSPYFAVYRVMAAAQDQDMELLASQLDLESIKSNVGVALRDKIDSRVIETIRQSPLGDLPLIAANCATDALLDEIVSPNTVAYLLRGQKLTIFPRKTQTIKAVTTRPEVHWEYERDHDHFVMIVRSRLNSASEEGTGTRFVFFRYGWIGGWRIVAIKLSDVRDIISIE